LEAKLKEGSTRAETDGKLRIKVIFPLKQNEKEIVLCFSATRMQTLVVALGD
jgi:hypothetical protein